MKFGEFQRVAREAFEAIPEEFRQGIDGLVVVRDAEVHPRYPDIYTLGYCNTESYPSDWVGPETTRSVIQLFYGSFQGVAAQEEDFDWEAEIHETIEHEIRHHVESLAGQDALDAVDYAMDEGFRRARGEDFDPLYYQQGEDLGGGLYKVEDQYFLEIPWDPSNEGPPGPSEGEIVFSWEGEDWSFPFPVAEGDVHYVWIHGLDAGPGGLEVVLVRKRGWWETLKGSLRGWRPLVEIWEADARRNPPGTSGS